MSGSGILADDARHGVNYSTFVLYFFLVILRHENLTPKKRVLWDWQLYLIIALIGVLLVVVLSVVLYLLCIACRTGKSLEHRVQNN